MKRPIILSLFLSLLAFGLTTLLSLSLRSRAPGPSVAKELDYARPEAWAPKPQSRREELRRGAVATAAAESHSVPSATRGRGHYRISGEVEELVVIAPGYAAERKEIDAEPQEDSEDESEPARLEVDLRLGKGLAVEGQVTDRSGKALPGVRVAVAPDDLVLDLSDERLEERLVGELSAVTDTAGHFRIGGLPAWALDLPGSFDLEFHLPGSGAEILETVEVKRAPGELRKDLVLDLEE